MLTQWLYGLHPWDGKLLYHFLQDINQHLPLNMVTLPHTVPAPKSHITILATIEILSFIKHIW